MLSGRICRGSGIARRLTKPRSPATTGKTGRLHQSLQPGLPGVHGPFESLAALQVALDAWREEYNAGWPHQSPGMAFPASQFVPAVSPLPLRVPLRCERLGPGNGGPGLVSSGLVPWRSGGTWAGLPAARTTAYVLPAGT